MLQNYLIRHCDTHHVTNVMSEHWGIEIERRREESPALWVRIGLTRRGPTHSCFKKIFCADKWAPVSNNNPDRNAQNIMLTDKANGP
jgi:hypothetical protein